MDSAWPNQRAIQTRSNFDSTALPISLKTRSFSNESSSTVATSTPSSLAMKAHNSEKMGAVRGRNRCVFLRTGLQLSPPTCSRPRSVVQPSHRQCDQHPPGEPSIADTQHTIVPDTVIRVMKASLPNTSCPNSCKVLALSQRLDYSACS